MAIFRGLQSVVRQVIRAAGQNVKSQLPREEILPSKQRVTLELPRRLLAQFASARQVTKITLASSLRRVATQRIIGGRSASFSYLLAFVPFVFTGHENEGDQALKKASRALEFIHQGVQGLKERDKLDIKPTKLSELTIKERLGKNTACAAVYAASFKEKEVAVKIMFNYHYASNEQAIVKGFKQEIGLLCAPTETSRERSLEACFSPLPQHPNIVQAHTYFVDEMPMLYDSVQSYPSALPCRQRGHAHNRTLFLIMEKYSQTLREYCRSTQESNDKHSLYLLQQLLEALAHLRENQVAHVDLKSDNILLKMNGKFCPWLVVTDFGLSVFDKSYGLKIPYFTDRICKGGNMALLAPEIQEAEAGPGKYLDYDKADVWAAGALSYEIFGKKNPLYNEGNQLEPLTGGTWPLLDNLVRLMLQKDPNHRISARLAATYVHLLAFSPWTKLRDGLPSESQVQRWLFNSKLSLVFDLVFSVGMDIIDTVDLQLRLTFLLRTSVNEIMDVLRIMHNDNLQKTCW